MTRFKPIRQMRVSDEVAEQLKESIQQGYFKAGDKLPAERELADEFGVSRVAVRQALSALQNTGFVVIRQGAGGGAFITDLTFDHLVTTYLDLFLANKISIPELYQVRLLVEPEVARAAAGNVTAKYARRLEAALEKEKVFCLDCHRTLLQPSHRMPASCERGISARSLFHTASCFAFLATPSTVRISRAARLASSGNRVKSS